MQFWLPNYCNTFNTITLHDIKLFKLYLFLHAKNLRVASVFSRANRNRNSLQTTLGYTHYTVN